MTTDPRSLTPAGWARYTSNGSWKMAAHHALLNRLLMDLAARRITRLIVEMPPRHGKSDLCSGYFPSWYLGLFPDHEVLLASYEAQFAARWGRRNRDLLDRHGPDVFGIRVRSDSSAKSEWLIQDRKGGMSTAGVGGAITGKGANLLIVDDPVKNAEQANSATYRDRAWDWWESTASTRLQPDNNGLKPVVLVIQTRWHEDDLTGRLLKQEGEGWVRLSLPAVAEEDEWWTLPWWSGWGWSRTKGEALWAERYDLDTLARTAKRVGSYWWSALFQQRPVNREGGTLKPGQFRRFRVVEGGYLLDTPAGPVLVENDTLRRFATMDLAASERTQADYTALGVFGQTSSGELLVLDMQREQMGTGHADMAARTFAQFGLNYVGVEAVAMQVATVKDMRRGDPRTGRKPLPVRALKPQGDKVSRSLTLARFMEGGQVYVPEQAPWLDDMIEEVRQFPRGAHDDQIDVLSYAALEVAGGEDNILRTW